MDIKGVIMKYFVFMNFYWEGNNRLRRKFCYEDFFVFIVVNFGVGYYGFFC